MISTVCSLIPLTVSYLYLLDNSETQPWLGGKLYFISIT